MVLTIYHNVPFQMKIAQVTKIFTVQQYIYVGHYSLCFTKWITGTLRQKFSTESECNWWVLRTPPINQHHLAMRVAAPTHALILIRVIEGEGSLKYPSIKPRYANIISDFTLLFSEIGIFGGIYVRQCAVNITSRLLSSATDPKSK